GLREASDEVERIGIERAWQEIGQADRVLLMVDSSTTTELAPQQLLPEFMARLPTELPVTLIRNKVDLSGEKVGIDEVKGYQLIRISAAKQLGIDLLREHLKHSMDYNSQPEGGFIARRRHLQALEIAAEHLQAGQEQLMIFRAGELLAEELRLAQQALSEIT